MKLSLLLSSLLFSTGAFANPVSETYVLIPGGTLLQGSPLTEAGRYPDEGPQHEVEVRPFELQATEVTQAQWFALMRENNSYFKAKHNCPDTQQIIEGVLLCPDLPVDNISWHLAQEFVRRKNALNDGFSYRLPTEAEWELAARGGARSGAYSFGDNIALLPQHGWFDGDYDLGQSHRVASLLPNPFGLYDMHGNVWEWVEDVYAYYPGSDLPVPNVPERRALKGGSWFSMARNLRSAMRMGFTPDEYNETLGFRVVREIIAH